MNFDSFEHNFHSESGPVFILASGPSAASFPLEQFPSIPVIAMNGSILKCEEVDVRPCFYLCDDPSFIEARPMLAAKGVEQAKSTAMTADCYEQLASLVPGCLDARHLYLMSRLNRRNGHAIKSDKRFAWSIRKDPHLHSYFSLLHAKPNRVGFSMNMAKGYFGSRTIPFAGLQLACHLGFNRVFLLGVDLNPSAGRFYEQGDMALPSTLDLDYEDYILPSFRLLSERIVVPGRFEVFNLSSSSRLPASIIPRLSLSELYTWVRQTELDGSLAVRSSDSG